MKKEYYKGAIASQTRYSICNRFNKLEETVQAEMVAWWCSLAASQLQGPWSNSEHRLLTV